MISTLILLYALNSFGDVPQWCFIVAWVLAIAGPVFRALLGLDDKKK